MPDSSTVSKEKLKKWFEKEEKKKELTGPVAPELTGPVEPSDEERADATKDRAFADRVRAVLGDAKQESGLAEHEGKAETKGFHLRKDSSGFISAEDLAAREKEDRATEKTMQSLWDTDKKAVPYLGREFPTTEQADPSAPEPPAKKPAPSLKDRVTSTKPPAPPTTPDTPTPPSSDFNSRVRANIADADLGAELTKAKEQFKSDKDSLAFREAVEGIANGLGKIGAGMYGNKTGTDMSAVKFDSKDWDKKGALASDEFKTSLADIGDRRRQQAADRQFNDKMDQDASQFDRSLTQRSNEFTTTSANEKAKAAETRRHNKATEAISRGLMNTKGEALKAKMGSTQRAAFNKGINTTSKALYDISQKLEKKEVSEDMAMSHIQTLLQTQLGLSPEQAKEHTMDEGWVWDSLKNPAEINAKINEMATAGLGAKETRSSVDPGYVAVTSPEGKVEQVPEANLEAVLKRGYVVVK